MQPPPRKFPVRSPPPPPATLASAADRECTPTFATASSRPAPSFPGLATFNDGESSATGPPVPPPDSTRRRRVLLRGELGAAPGASGASSTGPGAPGPLSRSEVDEDRLGQGGARRRVRVVGAHEAAARVRRLVDGEACQDSVALEAARQLVARPDARPPPRSAQRVVLARSTAAEPLDVLVVGGGATGYGIALDAATKLHLKFLSIPSSSPSSLLS